jgi:hypothetical protein
MGRLTLSPASISLTGRSREAADCTGPVQMFSFQTRYPVQVEGTCASLYQREGRIDVIQRAFGNGGERRF